MDRMEIAIDSLAGSDAEKASKDMRSACNTFLLNKKDFCDLVLSRKPKIRKLWTDICWYWVKRLFNNYANENYDKRNEQACYTGYYFYDALVYKFGELPDLPQDSFISTFIAGMAYAHRTIQQSFSSLVFAWLNMCAGVKNDRKAKYAVAEIIKMRGEHWYNMPMV